MSHSNHQNQTAIEQSELAPPLDSAADIKEVDYPRAFCDGSITWTISEQGRERAPNKESVWRHQIGLAGEIGVGTALGVRANWDTYPDYVGDAGYDLIYNGYRVEVKAVVRGSELELKIPEQQIQSADYFALTRVTESLRMIELIGWIRSPELRRFGQTSPYDNRIRVDPQYLLQFDTGLGPISPEEIRAVQSL